MSSAAQGGGGWRNGLSSGRRYLKQRAFRNPTFNQVFGEGRSISRFQRKSSVPCHFSMCTSLQKGELAYWENKIKIEPFMAERGSAEVEVHQVWTEQGLHIPQSRSSFPCMTVIYPEGSISFQGSRVYLGRCLAE